MDQEVLNQLPEGSGKDTIRDEILRSKPESPEAQTIAKEIANECYAEVIDVLDYYMDMPDESKELIAVWIIGTYIYKEFDSYPFLYVNAMKGSGKTRLLRLIKHLCWNGQLSLSPTEATLFRAAGNSTFIIDENEQIANKEKSAIRQLLNSCYKKGTSVQRMKKVKHKDGEDFISEKFDMYSPVVTANINGMDEVLGDRSLTLVLEKSSDLSRSKLIEDFESNDQIDHIGRKLSKIQCSLRSVVTLRRIDIEWNKYIKIKYTNYITTYNTLNTLNAQKVLDHEILHKLDKTGINGRNLELIFPLLMVVQCFNTTLIDDFLLLAQNMVKSKMEEDYVDSPDVALYEFISKKEPLIWYNTTDLAIQFKQYYLSDNNDRDWLNSRWMGKALKRLKLTVQKKRKSNGIESLLDISKAIEKIKMFKVIDEDDGEKK